MNRKYILITFVALLIPLSSFLIYRYAVKLKSENNTSNHKNISQSVKNNNNFEKNDLNNDNHKDYCIPNVEIKSLLYDRYDDKDKSKKIIEIKVEYLVIENKNNLESIDKLNGYLKNEAEKRVDDIRKSISDLESDYADLPEEYHCYTCVDECKVKKNNQHGIISILLFSYEHMGPIRPWELSKSCVLDCITGKKLSIFDVIKGNKNDIIDMIKKEAIKNISKIDNTISEEELKNNLFIDDKSNEDWTLQPFYLDNSCLVIEFSKGDIAPAAWGMISVDIPYDVIKSYELDIDSKFIE